MWVVDTKLHMPGYTPEEVAEHAAEGRHVDQSDWIAWVKRTGPFKSGMVNMQLQFSSWGVSREQAERIVQATIDGLNAADADAPLGPVVEKAQPTGINAHGIAS